jgi:hypothetical protein
MTFLLCAINAALCLVCVRYFDAAVRWVYFQDRYHWESLGSPPGFLWVPPETGWWSGSLARQQFASQLFLGRKAWMRESRELLRLRRGYLLSGAGSFLIAVSAMALNS